MYGELEQINKVLENIDNDLSNIGLKDIKSKLVCHYEIIPKLLEVNIFGDIIQRKDTICEDDEFYILLNKNDKYVGHIRFTNFNKNITSFDGIIKMAGYNNEDGIILSSFVIESDYRGLGIGGILLNNIEKMLAKKYKFIIGKVLSKKASIFYKNNKYIIIPIKYRRDELEYIYKELNI